MTEANNSFEDIVFPQYRMYINGKSYFKILSLDFFEEKYFVGKRLMKRDFLAAQYPDKLFIRDLLLNYQGMAVEISASEYNSKV